MSGPVLGSVPEPVKMPPRPWPVTQKSGRQHATGGQERGRPAEQQRPEADDQRPMASTQVAHSPPLPRHGVPKLFRKWAYALGSPDAMPVIALDMDVVVRFCGGGTGPRPATSSRPTRSAA